MQSGSRPAVVLLTLVYVVLAGVAVADDSVLHDEGLLTHLLASLVGREPLATIFLQKARPPLALLYSPVAGLGLSAFLWVHVLVSAAAIPLVASTARRLGHGRPEIAAAVVALSPMHVAAGAAGLMNADAVVGVALVAWLWAGRRLLGAGLVMGALVFVRAELAVLALTFAAVTAWRRQPRAWLGLVGFPLVYGLCGIGYHHDVLWMFRFPPALAEPMADNPFWRSHAAAASLPLVTGALLAITPTLPLLGLWRWRDASEVERAGLAFCLCFFAALVLMPRWQVFNFDLSPRYLLPMLPVLALAVGRTATALGPEDTTVGGLRRGLGLLVFAGLALGTERLGGGSLGWQAVLVASVAVALGGAGRTAASLAWVGFALALGPISHADGARIARAQHSPALDGMVERLAEHPEWEGRSIYTNEPLLDAYLDRVDPGEEHDVRYMVQADQLHELTSLSNPDNGQRQALLDALRQGFFGVPVLPDELTPESIPPGVVFVLRKDPRLDLVLPHDPWDGALVIVHDDGSMRVALRGGGGR